MQRVHLPPASTASWMFLGCLATQERLLAARESFPKHRYFAQIIDFRSWLRLISEVKNMFLRFLFGLQREKATFGAW